MITEVIQDIHTYQQTIASAVEEQSVTANQLVQTVKRIVKGAGEISGRVGEVQAGNQKTVADAGETLEAAREVSESSGTLRRLIDELDG